MLRSLGIALRFLTRVPVPGDPGLRPGEAGRALLAFPLVGLLLGLALWLAAALLAPVDAGLGAALVLVLWVALTGGLHLDGLADSADAWAGAGGDRQRTLEILRDTHSGSWAVLALILVLLLKYAALEVLLRHDLLPVLAGIPLLARALLLWLFRSTPYVRAGGLGGRFSEELDPAETGGMLALVAAGVLLLGGVAGAILLLVAVMVLGGMRAWMLHRLGGMTGDTAGALVELAEMAMLVAAGLLLA